MPDDRETGSTPGTDTRQPDPVTGGMVAGSPADTYERDREADLWGSAEAEDIHEGLANAADVTPDEAAEILFGDEAEEVRAAARQPEHDAVPDPQSARAQGESPVD